MSKSTTLHEKHFSFLALLPSLIRGLRIISSNVEGRREREGKRVVFLATAVCWSVRWVVLQVRTPAYVSKLDPKVRE